MCSVKCLKWQKNEQRMGIDPLTVDSCMTDCDVSLQYHTSVSKWSTLTKLTSCRSQAVGAPMVYTCHESIPTPSKNNPNTSTNGAPWSSCMKEKHTISCRHMPFVVRDFPGLSVFSVTLIMSAMCLKNAVCHQEHAWRLIQTRGWLHTINVKL